jgi:hypothetical protein
MPNLPQTRRTDPLADFRPKPITMRALPPGRPAAPDRLLVGEHRNPQARTALLHRVYAEFSEMPGLCPTLAQAIRLFGLREDICLRVLGTLSADGLLRRTPDGRFVRADEIL